MQWVRFFKRLRMLADTDMFTKAPMEDSHHFHVCIPNSFSCLAQLSTETGNDGHTAATKCLKVTN